MAYIQRANVVLQVEDSEVEYYLNLGYNEITKDGKIIRETVPTDLHLLQKHYVDSKKKIAELEDEIAKLKAKKTDSKPVEALEEEAKPRGRRKVTD